MTRAYLDYNATSPLRPEARLAMLAALEIGANASSVHAPGRRARALIEDARAQVAALAGAKTGEVIFTSGGTEACWLALHGAIAGAMESAERITRLFVSAIEHDCVRANAAALAERIPGLRLSVLPVSGDGLLDLEALRVALREGKGRALVAVMAANNETGAIQPLDEIRTLTNEAAALYVCDAVQAAGKGIAVNADYVALSGHKLGGAPGAGALIVRDGVPFAAQILGGGQEKRRRAGTENAAAIAAFGAAAATDHAGEQLHIAVLRDEFERGLLAEFPDATVFAASAPRMAGTSNFAIPGLASETAVMALDLDGVAVSAGAACSSGKVARSHVLEAMGIEAALAGAALRVSFGWNSQEQDGAQAIAALKVLRARKPARAAA